VHDFFSAVVKFALLVGAVIWFVSNPGQAGDLAGVAIDFGGRFIEAVVAFVSGVTEGLG